MADGAPPPKPSEPFRRLLARAVLVPFVLLVALAVALAASVTLLVRSARLTQRSDEVLTESARLRELLVDRETARRGYLLSGNETFFQPLVLAEQQLPLLGSLAHDVDRAALAIEVHEPHAAQFCGAHARIE